MNRTERIKSCEYLNRFLAAEKGERREIKKEKRKISRYRRHCAKEEMRARRKEWIDFES